MVRFPQFPGGDDGGGGETGSDSGTQRQERGQTPPAGGGAPVDGGDTGGDGTLGETPPTGGGAPVGDTDDDETFTDEGIEQDRGGALTPQGTDDEVGGTASGTRRQERGETPTQTEPSFSERQAQGVEIGDSQLAGAASEFESQVVEQTGLDPIDVRVERQGDRLVAEPTATGVEALQEQREAAMPSGAMLAQLGGAVGPTRRPQPDREVLTAAEVGELAGSVGPAAQRPNEPRERRPPAAGGGTALPESAQPDTQGQTFLDERIEVLEQQFGVDVIPGEGDVVQGTEEQLEQTAQDIREGETFIPSPEEAETFARDAAGASTVSGSLDAAPTLFGQTGGEAVENVAAGIARPAAQTANLPAAALAFGRLGEGTGELVFNRSLATNPLVQEAGATVPGVEESPEELEAVGEERFAEQAEATAETAAALGAATVESVRERPFQTLGTGIFFGGAALAEGVAIERGAAAARSARTAARARTVVDLDDITSQRGAQGALPEFETSPSAPTREAVQEVRERAADQPDEIQEAADTDELLFRSESEALPEDFTAQRGQFELPGLFASPDLSPLRLTEGSSIGIGRPRLPRIFGSGEQVTAFPGDEIGAFPESATGAGFAVQQGDDVITGLSRGEAERIIASEGGERIPDPTTSGARFLEEEADEGTAFVRPRGSRTTELEAIFPPGSGFTEVETFGVRTGRGQIIPGRAFARAEATDVDAPDASTAGAGDDVFGVSDLPETRISEPDGRPVAPTPLPGTGGAGATTASTSATGGIATTVAPTATFGTSAPETLFGGVASQFGASESGAPSSETRATGESGGSTQPSDGPERLFGSFASPPTSGTPSLPGAPTGAPPTSAPPSTPGGSPFGTPTAPPSTPAGPLTFFGGPPQQRGDSEDELREPREQEADPQSPFGLQFVNPIQSAQEALFGAAVTFGGFGGER